MQKLSSLYGYSVAYQRHGVIDTIDRYYNFDKYFVDFRDERSNYKLSEHIIVDCIENCKRQIKSQKPDPEEYKMFSPYSNLNDYYLDREYIRRSQPKIPESGSSCIICYQINEY